MMDERIDEDLSESEIEEFYIENERLLTEDNLAVRNVEQCHCGIASTSDKAIRCDNDECPRQWFHLDCVGLSEEPEGEWFCCLPCINQSVIASSDRLCEEVNKGNKETSSSSGSGHSAAVKATRKIGTSNKGKMKYPPKQCLEKEDIREAVCHYLDDALTSISNSYIMMMETPLSISFQDLIKRFKEEASCDKVKEFVGDLIGQLWDVVDSVRGETWSEGCKEKMWRQFHVLRCDKVVKDRWHRLLMELSISKELDAETILLQTLMEELFKSLIQFAMDMDLPPKSESAHLKSLDSNEEAALRYACGYVPFKLIKRYRKLTRNSLAEKYVVTLEGWGEVGAVGEDSFLQYTKEWIELQNRGGLFSVKDDVFKFFRAAEIIIKSVLFLKNITFIQRNDIQKVLLTELLRAEPVKVCWNKIATGLHGEIGDKLSEDVLKCFLKMRCEAFVKVYLMLRKRNDDQVSRQGEKSLRKNLQQQK